MIGFQKRKGVLLVVDLDYTLVEVNTVYDFLEKFYSRRFLLISRLLFPLLFFNRLLKTDIYKQLLVTYCFKNVSEQCLRNSARTYFNYILRHRDRYLNQSVLEILLRQDDTTTKMLLTASLSIIAEQFKELGFDLVISSKTFFKNGKYSGMFDIFMKKHRILGCFSKYFDQIIIFDDDPEPEYNNIKNTEVRVIKVHGGACQQ